MTSFLFVVVAEGLIEMMREATSRNMYSSYKVGKNKVEVNLLQYADDTLFLVETTLNNVLVINSILR